MRVTPRWNLRQPAWSANGRLVAFEKFTGDNESKIVVADARGRRLGTFGAGHVDQSPLWSPGGRQLAYWAGSAHAAGFVVARPDGSHHHGFPGGGCSGYPIGHCPANLVWAPSGARLAWDDQDDSSGEHSIFSARADGTGSRELLVADASDPAYSPDRSSLAYVGADGIEVAAANGTGPRLVFPVPPLSDPVDGLAWSPDSRTIAFRQGRAIQAIGADGSNLRMLTANASGRPVWSPGGGWVAFKHLGALVVVKPDGTGGHVAVASASGSEMPAWRPAVVLPAAKRARCSPTRR